VSDKGPDRQVRCRRYDDQVVEIVVDLIDGSACWGVRCITRPPQEPDVGGAVASNAAVTDHLPIVVGIGAEVRVGDQVAIWD